VQSLLTVAQAGQRRAARWGIPPGPARTRRHWTALPEPRDAQTASLDTLRDSPLRASPRAVASERRRRSPLRRRGRGRQGRRGRGDTDCPACSIRAEPADSLWRWVARSVVGLDGYLDPARRPQGYRTLPQRRRVQPESHVSDLVAAAGLSAHYCSLIRLGKRVPHPRHWVALGGLVAGRDRSAQ
jgi:hypothetical protein